MNLFSRSGGENLYLVFDVGSSSVGGALCSRGADGTPKIITSVREPIVLEEGLEGEKLLANTAKCLESVAAQIAKSGSPKRIFLVLSSPWYSSQTRIIKLRKEFPFTFNASLADELIKKETELFKQEHFHPNQGTNLAVRLLELKNIRITLNGYETATPLNQKATELEMAIFVSMSGEETIKKFEEAVHQHFGVRNLEFCSFALASFTVVRDLHKKSDSFLLVDIGGEMTDVSMVKKNMLYESISFPLGRNYLIRGAASLLSCSLFEAESCISLFKDGHTAEETKKKIEPIITKVRVTWLQNFQKALADLSNDISVPSTIYLSVDDDLEGFFTETIKSEQFSQHTLTESKFDIIPLNTEFFHGFASFGNDTPRDSFLISNAIYVNHLLNKASSTELDKVSLQGKI
jgi:cell division ATPase FtsA